MAMFRSKKAADSSSHITGSRNVAYILHLLSPAFACTVAVLAGEYLINRIYFQESVIFEGSWFALVCNILILFSFMVLLLALINRLLLAIFVGLLCYGLLIAVDITKLTYLDNPLRPTDFQYLADLRVVARSCIHARTIIEILVACTVAVVICIFLWRKESPAMLPVRRICTGVIAAALLISFFALPYNEDVQWWIIDRGIQHPITMQFEPRASARDNGLLADWAISAAEAAMRRPERYSRDEIERIARTYQQEPEPNPVTANGQPVNLIIYLIESFMDPQDLGVRYTSDPIPTFHAISRKYSSGRVVVPVFGGASANTEFELLTSLSMYFLPASSCPYRQFMTRDIPSLPRALHGYGYKTVAITADPPYLFNRKAAFGHLGFDRWIFPVEDPQTPRGPDPDFAADDATANAVLDASKEGGPFFIFAFTSGSHFPWDYPDYQNSRLGLVKPMKEPYGSRLKTYINALNVADRSLKKVIEHFEKSDQKTLIMVMGDHLPALAEVYDQTGFFKNTGLTQIKRRYSVPSAIWCNWPATKEDFLCSVNFMAVKLLHLLQLRTSGSLALNAGVQSQFSVLSQYVKTADGRQFLPQVDEVSSQPLLDDYGLIEYDLLKGRQYALGIPGWQIQ
jgi:phosphoglycerol transferase MdoB-like AlkP superfamily enzyme